MVQQQEDQGNQVKEGILGMAGNSQIMPKKDVRDICVELRECKLNEFLEEKRRQQLRDNDHELRQLQSHLKSALVFKQLREQQNCLAQLKAEKMRIKREEDLKFAAECELIKSNLLKEEEETKRKKDAYRGLLNEQINEHQQKRRLEFENVIKDREDMNKLLERLQKEDIQDRNNTYLLREKFKKEMEESYRNRALQKQLEKEMDFDDNERYLAYRQKCDDLKAKLEADRKFLLKEKEAVSERIGQQVAQLRYEKQKRSDLLIALFEGERKAKENEKYRENIEKQVEQREKLRIEEEIYHNVTLIQQEKHLKEEEEQFRQEYLRYLEERDKLSQLSDEKRRRKKLEHSKALREMIELKRIERAREVAERINEFEKLKSIEKER